MVTMFVLLVAIHFIADFPFQGDYLANNKGKSWEAMFYHCAVYTATFILFAHVSLLSALFIFVTHFIIDNLKARYKVIKSIWFDQILHVIILCIICVTKM